MKQPTIEQLCKLSSCTEGIEWYKKNKKRSAINTINAADFDGIRYCSWYITKLMNKKQAVKYAIYAAEKALHVYENIKPNDTKLCKAICAAQAWLDNPCIDTEKKAYAEYSVYIIRKPPCIVYPKDYVIANAEYAVANAAYTAYLNNYDFVYTAYVTAHRAANAAAHAAYDNGYIAHLAYEKTLREIVLYGVSLIDGGI